MKLLKRIEFENKNFVHYLRTGEFYFYESYLEWFAKLEFKSLGVDTNNFIPDPNKTYCVWNGGECGGCSSMAGKIFEITDISDTHPNCNCSCDIIDDLAEFTGEKIKPKPKKPKKNCARVTGMPGKRDIGGGASKDHQGIDIAAPKGTTVKSIEGGKVIHAGIGKSGINGGFGNFVVIEHLNKDVSIYGHLDSYNVAIGNIVNEGDIIRRSWKYRYFCWKKWRRSSSF